MENVSVYILRLFITEKSTRYTIKSHFLNIPKYRYLPHPVTFVWIPDWRGIAYIVAQQWLENVFTVDTILDLGG